MIPAALLVRRPPALAGVSALSQRGPQSGMSIGEALRSPQFVILVLTNFCCCATHSGPIIHTVSYAVTCGIPMIAAVSIYSVEGLAGMFGRVGFGVLSSGDECTSPKAGLWRGVREHGPRRFFT